MVAGPAKYRPRSHEPTLLHTLVVRHHGDLRAEALDAHHPDGSVPAFVVRALGAFLACHDLRRGFVTDQPPRDDAAGGP